MHILMLFLFGVVLMIFLLPFLAVGKLYEVFRWGIFVIPAALVIWGFRVTAQSNRDEPASPRGRGDGRMLSGLALFAILGLLLLVYDSCNMKHLSDAVFR